MSVVEVTGRALPIFILYPTLALFCMLTALSLRKIPSHAAKFVVFAVGARFVLSALHEITYKPSPLGLSWNALGSITVCALGLFALRRRFVFSPGLLPFYPILIIMILSGLINFQPAPLASVITKFAYLIVLMLATADAIEDVGGEYLCKKLITPIILPLVLQAFSVLLGWSKPGEDGGAASYIGGFNHEAGFSMMIASGVLIACLMPSSRLRPFFLKIVVLVSSVFLANYRTVIIGLMPLICVTIAAKGQRRFVSKQRGIVLGVLIIILASGVTVGSISDSDRFSDLGVAFSEGTSLIKRPQDFSTEDRRLMSGRPMIWSWYFYGWYDADVKQKVVGFGPETWTEAFKLYAHNTLISALYETGISGVIATCLLWAWMLLLAILGRGGQRAVLIAGHISFFVLNMATMPMWMIEGMIFYAILCGFTLYYWSHRRDNAGCLEKPLANRGLS